MCTINGDLVRWHKCMGLWDTLIVWGKNHFQHLISGIGEIKFPGKFNEIFRLSMFVNFRLYVFVKFRLYIILR